jgi:hypothetical protein
MKKIIARDLSKIIGFDEEVLEHIKNKLLRDACETKGNNKLNPYKNRGKRWSWPVVLLEGSKEPAGWKNAESKIRGKGKNCYVTTKYSGWGYYIKYEDWRATIDSIIKMGCSVKTNFGRFKVGIPYEEAATQDNCILVALTLAYQAHRIMGLEEDDIKKKFPELYEAVQEYEHLKNPICPFCKNQLTPDGFIEITEDTTDVFYKRKEAEDNAIQLFHIKCLKPGEFLHKPGNVSWGHRRCNVAIGKHDISDAEGWFVNVLKNRGFQIK